jgi:signal transduction histidine kinase
VRTPITRLKLRAEYLQDSDQYQKILADLNEMENMLSSVLTFAREDARNAVREQFDLNALLDSLCNDMSDAGFNVSYQGVDKRLPFFGNINTLRREQSRLRKTGGTGLGLTIARDSIRAHNGEITLINLPQGGLRILIAFNS